MRVGHYLYILNIGQRSKCFHVATEKIPQLQHIYWIALIQLTSSAKFVQERKNQDLISGGAGIIHCSALGNPAPHFKWSKNDRRLQNGRFIQLANGSLRVNSIQRDDKGTYTCTIHQSRGSESTSEKSQTIEVSIIGKTRKKHCYLNVLNHQYIVKKYSV